jgi:DNA-directed RNA polymerase subunit RPC12/RpoP
MTEPVGGYRCPYCKYRAVVGVLVRDHIRKVHPKENP